MFTVKIYRFLVVTLLFCWIAIPSARAEDPVAKTVGISPLTIHSAKDVSYLQAGIRSMIASRLAADAGVRVDLITPGQSSTESGPYDYQIHGSLTSLGSALSLDIEVIDQQVKDNPRHFYATAATENDIIGAVDKLASEISRDVFSVPKASEKPVAAGESTPAPSPTESKSTGNWNVHPEKAFIAGESNGSNLLRPVRGGFRQFEKTQTLTYGIQTFAIGDIDGDEVEDFILGQPSGLKCYHMVEGRLQQFSYYPLASGFRVLNISMADLDGDKKDEVYVATKAQGRPISLGLVWQGDHLVETFQDTSWYIRALQDPIAGWLLAGQKVGDSKPLENGIYELRIKNNNLEEGNRLDIPAGVTLFSFTLADVDGDGKAEIVMLDKNDYLQVVRTNGSTIWASSAIYGGSPTYIGNEREAGEDRDRHNALEPENWNRVTVPPRIIATDLNGDGIKDIVICRNNPRFSKIVANARSYDSTELYGLAWNGVALDILWQTRKIDGFITDIAYRPVPNDSKRAKLYAGLILPTGVADIVSEATSTLLTFDIDVSPEKKN